MHRIEALSQQRGKGDTPPVDRKSPYFGHLRLEEAASGADVLIGARSFVEPGGGVQIVDWRNAPVSRLFYRYEEGDATRSAWATAGRGRGARAPHGRDRRRRAAAGRSPQGTFSRDLRTGQWREVATRQARLQIARDGSGRRRRARGAARRRCRRQPRRPRRAASWASTTPGRAARSPPARHRGADRSAPVRADHRPSSGLIAIQGIGGSGKTTIGLHRIAYLAFAIRRRFRRRRCW
jgi:DNA helicase-2/ATP-dependent DNA helicase PcrA